MRRRGVSRDLCFYCGALVSGAVEKDHFPVSKSKGGTMTVPACMSCHDMKDRFPLGDWPMDWTEKIVADFPKFNRETRLFLAKVMSHIVTVRNETPCGV